MNDKMKKVLLWITATMFIAFAIGIAIIAIDGGLNLRIENTNDGESSSINEDKTLSADCNIIDIDAVSSNIELHVTDENEIRAKLQGSYIFGKSTNGQIKLVTENKGNKGIIRVDYPKSFGIGTTSFNLDLDVYIPKSYVGAIEVNNVSGSILIDELKLDRFEAETLSGSIKAKLIDAQSVRLKTISGRVLVDECVGELKVNTTSGSIDVNMIKLVDDINMNSISGSIDLIIPEEADLRLKASSLSGSIKSDINGANGRFSKSFDMSTSESADIRVDLKTTSGSIDIETR